MNTCTNNRQQCCPCESADACERDFLPEVMTATMAYVPFQLDLSHFSPEEALCKGTLFHELDKPFRGRCTT